MWLTVTVDILLHTKYFLTLILSSIFCGNSSKLFRKQDSETRIFLVLKYFDTFSLIFQVKNLSAWKEESELFKNKFNMNMEV